MHVCVGYLCLSVFLCVHLCLWVALHWKDNLCFRAIPAKNSRLITWFAGNLTLGGHRWQIPSYKALAAAAHILLKGHLGPIPISSQNSVQYLLTADKAILHFAVYLTSQSIFSCININCRKQINLDPEYCKNNNIFYSGAEINQNRKKRPDLCFTWEIRLSLHRTHMQRHTYAWSHAPKETWKQSRQGSSKTTII